MIRIFLVCLGLSVLSFVGRSSAVSVDSLWSVAGVQYSDELYGDAAASYAELVPVMEGSWELCYNLGNCYYKLGDMGRAILWYSRAERLDPGNSGVLHNLSLAEARTVDRIDSVPDFFVVDFLAGVRDMFGGGVWAVLFLLFFCVGCGFFVWWWRVRRGGFMSIAIVAFSVSLVSLLFGVSANNRLENDRYAVVLNSSSVVRASPGGRAQELFVLHSGTVLEVLERSDNYSLVEVSSGDQGWLLSADIEQI